MFSGNFIVRGESKTGISLDLPLFRCPQQQGREHNCSLAGSAAESPDDVLALSTSRELFLLVGLRTRPSEHHLMLVEISTKVITFNGQYYRTVPNFDTLECGYGRSRP